MFKNNLFSFCFIAALAGDYAAPVLTTVAAPDLTGLPVGDLIGIAMRSANIVSTQT